MSGMKVVNYQTFSSSLSTFNLQFLAKTNLRGRERERERERERLIKAIFVAKSKLLFAPNF